MSAAGFADRWVGRAGTIAFVVAALALARVIGGQFPQPIEEVEEPHRVTGTVGEQASLRAAEITVDEVRLGPELVGPGLALTTDGVWVVADVTFTPTLEDAGLAYVQVVDGEGRIFRATRPGTSTCNASGPGIPLSCSLAIEVPADAVPGATLQLAPEVDPRYDNLLELPLGLTEDAVGTALTGEGVELRPATPGRTS